jgi:phage replication O-like protein O
MANPQLEDGRTEIANEIVEALAKTYLSPAENKIIWAVFRKTYGWHKKTDHISYSQFEEMTGLDKRHIGAPLQRLIERKIIFSTNAGERRTSEYGIQKNWELWQLTPESVTDKKLNPPLRDRQTDTIRGGKLTPLLVTASDTDRGDRLTLETVTEEQANPWPIEGQTDTNSGVRLTPKMVTASDTEGGVKLTPKMVTAGKTNLTPVQGTSDTSVGQSDTGIGPNLLPKPVTTKANNKSILQKQYTKANKIFVLPDWVEKEVWDDFVKMRARIKNSPLTEYGKKLLVSDLEKLKNQGNDPVRVIEESIKHGWKGFFPLKENRNDGERQNGSEFSAPAGRLHAATYQGNLKQPAAEEYERSANAANVN